MWQRSRSPEQNVRPGTEYARSVGRVAPHKRRRSAKSLLMQPMLNNPVAPGIALALLAAGIAMLWPKMAHGGRMRRDERSRARHNDRALGSFGDAGRQPDRRQAVSSSGLASGLQPGGVTPGGSPGAGVGSIGTGGGSTAGEHTGTARHI